MIALVASVAACTDDYKDWAEPQTVAQPTQVSFADGSITTVGTIDFNSYAEELVKVCSITAPTTTAEGFEPSFAINLGNNTYDISADGTNLTNRHYYDYGGLLQPGCWAKISLQYYLKK